MWDKIKAACLRSLTVFWGYIKIAIGVALLEFNQLLDIAGQVINDPNLVAQIKQAVPPYIQNLWWVPALAGAITIACRLRGIIAAMKKVGA